MDPEQISLVKASFAEATAQPGALARVFYERLFEVAPALREMFPDDLNDQERKLTDELRAIVDLLDHVDQLIVRTSDLGMRHVGYGARAEHYEVVGEVILDALAKVLGTAFTPETERAWKFAYNLVAEAMQQGAAASTSRPGA